MTALTIEKKGYKTETDGNVIHLVKQKQETNKKRGVKSEVYAYEIEDVKKILMYFSEREEWLHYLLFTISCNMARRFGDTARLQWKHFYNPKTGKIRENIEIEEEKTDKLANPKINRAVREAIELYIRKTGCRPERNNYENYICLQLSGTHRGKIMTESSHYKALKRAAEAIGIEYNIGTHSARKFFGKTSRMLHPGDYDSMELLQSIYNHSDAKTTKRYIGLTKQKTDKYYDDMGDFFDEYIMKGKEFKQEENGVVVSLKSDDLRDIIKTAYEAGKTNAESTDAMVHVNAITALMELVEDLSV